jgi:F-type H+-transporting ATPase subunit beta
MKNKTSLSNLGTVVSVRGSVVDLRFDAYLPPIYSLLHAKEGKIAIEVLAQLDAQHVRGIALTPTQGLARGIAVEDTGGPLKAPVGKGILSRMFDVFGNVIDRQAAPTDIQWRTVHQAPPSLARRSTKSEIFETGIKVSDVLVPLERGGKRNHAAHDTERMKMKINSRDFRVRPVNKVELREWSMIVKLFCKPKGSRLQVAQQ